MEARDNSLNFLYSSLSELDTSAFFEEAIDLMPDFSSPCIKAFNENVLPICETVPEMTFSAGVFLNVLNVLGDLSDDANNGFGYVSNLSDITLGLVTLGALLAILMTQKNHPNKAALQKQIITLSVASSIQLFNVVAAGILLPGLAISLPALSFAVASAIDLAITVHETYEAYQEADRVDVWVTKRLKELELVIAEEQNLEAKQGHPFEIKAVTERKEELLNDIKARVNVYCNAEGISSAERDYRVHAIGEVLSSYQPKMPAFVESITVHVERREVSEDEKIRDKAIQQKLEENLQEKVVACAVKTISFIAMVCLVVPFPPLQTAGLVLMAALGVYFLATNAHKIKNKIEEKLKNKSEPSKQGMFKPASNKSPVSSSSLPPSLPQDAMPAPC